MFAPLGFVRGLTDDQIEALGDPDRVYTANLPTLEQASRGRLLAHRHTRAGYRAANGHSEAVPRTGRDQCRHAGGHATVRHNRAA